MHIYIYINIYMYIIMYTLYIYTMITLYIYTGYIYKVYIIHDNYRAIVQRAFRARSVPPFQFHLTFIARLHFGYCLR